MIVDTSVWIEFLRPGAGAAGDHLERMIRAGDPIAVPEVVLMELLSGTTAGARSWADLPAQAIKYIQRVQELIETPVALVSTSPEREDTILVRDPFVD